MGAVLGFATACAAGFVLDKFRALCEGYDCKFGALWGVGVLGPLKSEGFSPMLQLIKISL